MSRRQQAKVGYRFETGWLRNFIRDTGGDFFFPTDLDVSLRAAGRLRPEIVTVLERGRVTHTEKCDAGGWQWCVDGEDCDGNPVRMTGRQEGAMAKCKTCGSSSFRTEPLHEYHDDLTCEFTIVIVDGVEREVCTVCGTVRGIKIPNVKGLIAAVAVKRVMLSHKLTGGEVRFLRKALGWKAKELAEKLDVTAESVCRWEKGPQPINPTAERYLRLVVGSLLSQYTLVDFSPEHIVNMQIKWVRPPEADRPLWFPFIYLTDGQP